MEKTMEIGMVAFKLGDSSPWQIFMLTATAATNTAARHEMARFIEKKVHSCHAHRNINTTTA